MDMKRYFLINEEDLSPSVARTALLEVHRNTSADRPRLTEVDADGNYFATTMSMGQLNLFHNYLSQLNIPFKVLTERPNLKAAGTRTTKREATAQEAQALDDIFKGFEDVIYQVGKFFGGLDKSS